MLGGLGASGWHICCLLMRMIADGFVLDSSSMGSPGIEEVRWLEPLRPGTQIRVRVDRAGKPRLEEPAGHGPDQVPLRNASTKPVRCLTTMVTTAMFGRREPEARP